MMTDNCLHLAHSSLATIIVCQLTLENVYTSVRFIDIVLKFAKAVAETDPQHILGDNRCFYSLTVWGQLSFL